MTASALGLSLAELTSCAPALPTFKTSFKGNKITVPTSSFVESNLLIVRDMQMDFDILVVKKSDVDYHSIYMKCSHQANAVTATRTGLYCSSHGSAFDLDGNVTHEPATLPLQKFKTELVDGNILITPQF
jgi:nitrite reductase/ring-hydroxylating ferredoxin subunit